MKGLSSLLVDRREVLRQLAYICLTVASGAAFSRPGEAKTDKLSLDGLVGLLAKRRSVAVVGPLFLTLHPEEADLDTLVERLGVSLNALPAAGSRELEAVAVAIRARHTDDFRQGRLAPIGGWKLSLTELRLAAVIYRVKQS